jgi:hypothetical protein
MHRKKPRPASMDEVKISRDREDAVIKYADEAIGGMNLRIGPKIADMSDRDILALHNKVVSAMQASADAWEDVVIEIPVGREQVAFHPESNQWSPRGDVVRCLIEDDENGRPVFHVDGHELTLEEFGRLLVTHAGWGMRIAFVPDDRTHINPKVEVREPEEGER